MTAVFEFDSFSYSSDMPLVGGSGREARKVRNNRKLLFYRKLPIRCCNSNTDTTTLLFGKPQEFTQRHVRFTRQIAEVRFVRDITDFPL